MAMCSSSAASDNASVTNLQPVMAGAAMTQNSLPGGPARWPKEVIDVMDAYLSTFHHQESTFVDSSGGAIGNHGKLPPSQEEEELLVDINSHDPLPQGWEQHLDLRTGKVYYVDWKSCKMSTADPRKALKEAEEKVRGLISRAQEGIEASHYLSDEASECCITSSESSFSEDMWIGNESDSGVVDDMYRPQQDEAEREEEGIGDYNPCLNLFTNSSAPPSLASHSNFTRHGLELLGCHRCLSRFVIHRANPWCPSCHAFLV